VAKKTILVLYYTRGVYPLRNTIETHLYALRRYSKHHTIYINVALGFPWEYVRSMSIDAIIFHTSFCGMRWSHSVFFKFTAMIREISELPALKIAMPQDEFIHTDLLSKLIDDLKIDVVLSCANESQWPIIYKKVKRKSLKLQTVLTGYLDEKIVRKIKKFHKPLDKRKLWISYRAWRAAFWLGERGTHKVKIGDIFQAAAQSKNIQTDISLNDKDTISGMDWFRFLANSRSVIGTEGGASIIDRDGSLKSKVEEYLSEHPKASFEQVRSAVFEQMEGSLQLHALSPRHLEAVATKTCQILLEGTYSGALQPDIHYISVKEDYSNIDSVFARLSDTKQVQEMIDTAYRDIVKSNKFTYREFIKNIEDTYFDPLPTNKSSLKDAIKRFVLNRRDWMNWRIIHMEVTYLRNPKRYQVFAKLLKPVYRLFVQPI